MHANTFCIINNYKRCYYYYYNLIRTRCLIIPHTFTRKTYNPENVPMKCELRYGASA